MDVQPVRRGVESVRGKLAVSCICGGFGKVSVVDASTGAVDHELKDAADPGGLTRKHISEHGCLFDTRGLAGGQAGGRQENCRSGCPNFGGLVLGCIEANSCNQLLAFTFQHVAIYKINTRLHRSELNLSGFRRY